MCRILHFKYKSCYILGCVISVCINTKQRLEDHTQFLTVVSSRDRTGTEGGGECGVQAGGVSTGVGWGELALPAFEFS